MRVIAAGQRFVSDYNGIHTCHGYSAGAHYDPSRLGFGTLIGYDEHLLEPGAGFGQHRHRDVDIVSWVLEGVLEHSDDAGRVTLVRPGDVQVQHCGTGIWHTERNAVLSTARPNSAVLSNAMPHNVASSNVASNNVASSSAVVGDVVPRDAAVSGVLRFLQLTFLPTGEVDAPAYQLVENIGDAVVSVGRHAGGVPSLQVLALPSAAVVALPAGMQLHAHVTRGCVHIAGQRLSAGDSAELDGAELDGAERGTPELGNPGCSSPQPDHPQPDHPQPGSREPGSPEHGGRDSVELVATGDGDAEVLIISFPAA